MVARGALVRDVLQKIARLTTEQPADRVDGIDRNWFAAFNSCQRSLRNQFAVLYFLTIIPGSVERVDNIKFIFYQKNTSFFKKVLTRTQIGANL